MTKEELRELLEDELLWRSEEINYAQYLNGLGKKREEFDFALIATSMNKEFKAYENKNSKSFLFNNKKVPTDDPIHGLYRRANLLESSSILLSQTLIIEDEAIDTESNLWYVVLQKNLYRLGLPICMFEQYKSDINNLVNRRNTIAHGSRTDGVTESEYKKWEDSVKDVMENIVKKIYFYTNNEKYLRIEDE